MKPHGVLMLLLTGMARLAQAEEGGLESVQRVQWKHANYTNAKLDECGFHKREVAGVACCGSRERRRWGGGVMPEAKI